MTKYKLDYQNIPECYSTREDNIPSKRHPWRFYWEVGGQEVSSWLQIAWDQISPHGDARSCKSRCKKLQVARKLGLFYNLLLIYCLFIYYPSYWYSYVQTALTPARRYIWPLYSSSVWSFLSIVMQKMQWLLWVCLTDEKLFFFYSWN